MFKFIRKGHQPNFERQKIQRELFAFRKTVQHGFPYKTSALAWDPILRLLCIGSSNGSIKVYGQIGVEFYGQHKNIESVITKIEFINGSGKIVSLCDNNSLHLWEITKGYVKEIKSISLEGKLKKISTICVHSNNRNLFIGTEGGNIYLLNLKSFTIINNGTIYQDSILQNLTDEYKLNPGAVEVLLERPNNPDEILIGYNRGLLVLWNWKEKNIIEKFISTQQLESACWNDDGSQFISTHNDGSYATWSIENGQKPLTEPITTYGPFPCKLIKKLLQKRIGDDNLIAFAGGMPRSSYGDKFTVTLIHGEKHIVLDFTSKIIDFIIINGECTLNNTRNTSNMSVIATNVVEENVADIDENQYPDMLLVLAEEELVAIDLQSEDWSMINLPYLVSLHASAITCSQHVSQISEDLWNKLKEAGQRQSCSLFSKAAWAINGGSILDYDNKSQNRDLLLTGHEDGTVKFWDASGVALNLLYKMTTANIFCGDEIKDDTFPTADDEQHNDEDEWPTFKKTGIFDPYSDDPRLAIRRIILCPFTETLVICGTSGHVLVAKFENNPSSIDLQPITMNIVSDHDGFVWKGHAKLDLKSNPITQPAGFHIQALCQIHPPAAITSCTIDSQSNILAAGTAHGLAVFDYLRQTPIFVKCTLNPNDALSMGDTPISRRKSFKKSLRESFRRLRRGRSGRHQKQVNNNVASPSDKFSNRRGPPINASSSPIEAKPVERQIEARSLDDGMGSMVRCLYFVKTFLINMTTTVLTLWAGTNNGTIHVFKISLPAIAKRKDENVICQLAKEIQLKHRAPVISIMVLDSSNKPIPESYEFDNDNSIQSENSQLHRVLIISEEQFKIFTLPSLKPFNKYKLTAYEGSRVRKVAFPKFYCQINENSKHSEICLLCLTNLGDFLILSLPDLRRQLNSSAIKKEDISGISSLVFTKEGEAFYLHSSSEYQRLTVSATKVTLPKCTIKIIDDDQKSIEEEDTLHNHSGAKVVNGQILHDLQNSNVSQLTNGSSLGSKESSLTESKVEVNGDETVSQNITSTSSVGDITIDSVRDHIGTDLITQLASAAFKSNLNTTNSSNETNDSNMNDSEHKSNDTNNHSTEIN